MTFDLRFLIFDYLTTSELNVTVPFVPVFYSALSPQHFRFIYLRARISLRIGSRSSSSLTVLV